MDTSTLITTRFGASSTADDVAEGHDLTTMRVVVTGASSGLGVATARTLARSGAEVTLAVRNVDAGLRVARGITACTHNDRIRVARLELADPWSVEAFAGQWQGPLHLLINNAGIMATPFERTRTGWELQFATNHLGHLALARRLHDALAAGAQDRDGARIVALSSAAHLYGPVVLDDLAFERRGYDALGAYAQSKSANALFAVEASRRWTADGIVANSVNPGGIATGLQKHLTPEVRAEFDRAAAAGAFQRKTVEQGAATTIVAALDPAFGHTGGHYLDDCQEAALVPDGADPVDNVHGVKSWARDPETAAQVWDASVDLLDRAR